MRPVHYVVMAASSLALAAMLGAAPATAVTAPTPASVPQAVVHIRPGLTRPMLVSMAASPPTTASCQSSYGFECLDPTQIQQAYNLQPLYNKGINGAGRTIAIVDPLGSPTITSDLATFDQAFGLPTPPSFKIITPVGAIPAYDPTNATDIGWAYETTLDVEWAHVIAPDANIVLAETPVAETEGVTGFPQIVQAEEYIVNNHLGDVISQSFVAGEQTFPSKGSIMSLRGAYTDAVANHVTVVGGAGDGGATQINLDGSTLSTTPVSGWPATDPLVTAVGGTQLTYNTQTSTFEPPVVWNDSANTAVNEYWTGTPGPTSFATGGGVSSVFERPWYQNSVANIVGSMRGVPDISMSASLAAMVDIYTSFGGQAPGWYLDGGTSEATPLFAGVVALADQVAGHSLGLVNPALYAMSQDHDPGIVDVTSGNNTVSFTQNGSVLTVNGYSAGPGYDLASGVGTVNGALFVPDLAKAAS